MIRVVREVVIINHKNVYVGISAGRIVLLRRQLHGSEKQ
jgi:hypothetical protein